MRLVCISDTHLQHDFDVPDGDVLIHAGDATITGTLLEVINFARWFAKLPHQHKIFVPGNHDRLFEEQAGLAASTLPPGTHCLIDRSVVIEGVNFYGAPWQPPFYGWAFQPDEKTLANKWLNLPETTDVLITHGPPLGVLDVTDRGELVGQGALRAAVHWTAPALHVFGHIHFSHGKDFALNAKGFNTHFANAAICGEDYLPCNPPQLYDVWRDDGNNTQRPFVVPVTA